MKQRTDRGGRDPIDHPPGGHDDVINAAAGALLRAAASGAGALSRSYPRAPIPVSEECIRGWGAGPGR